MSENIEEKKSDEHSSDSKVSEEPLKLDFSKIKSFASNKQLISVLLVLLLLIIPMLFSITFRNYSLDLPITDNWARDSISNSLRTQFKNQVTQETPFLPPSSVEKEVNKRVDQYLASNRDQYEQAINANSDQIKARIQNENGTTYLLEIDPWFYFRQAQNILKNGHVGDQLRNGESFDDHMFFPIGSIVPNSLHPYFGVLVYSTFGKMFGKSLYETFFILPVILMTLAILPAFFIGRKVAGNFGGFVCGMIIAVNATLMSRTPAGFSDTDSYVILFPLLITWLFLEAYDAKSWKWRVILTALSGAFVGIFAFAWSGWWYILDIIILSMVGYVVYSFLIHWRKKDPAVILSAKKVAVMLLIFIVSAWIVYSLFFTPKDFIQVATSPVGFTSLKEAVQDTVWPNVYTTVAELNVVPIKSILMQVSGTAKFQLLYFTLALLGMMLCFTGKKFSKFDYIAFFASFVYYLLITKASYFILPSIPTDGLYFVVLMMIPPAVFLIWHFLKQTTGDNVKFGLFLLVWFAATLYSTTKGVRFGILTVLPFAIGFAIFVGKTYFHLTNYLHMTVKIKRAIIAPIVIAILLLLLIAPVNGGKSVATNEFPLINDDWYDALTYIRDNSDSGAVIHSWWDFGHWFKAIGDRAVTFDGGSQSSPMAHWIGKSLLTNNETLSVGILRMLDCGSNLAFDEVDKKINLTPRSIDILYSIVVLDSVGAKEVLLENGFNNNEADKVLEYTHCEPPEAFFIASEDLIGKSGVWSHFGSWDFNRSYLYLNVKPMKREQGTQFIMNYWNYSQQRAENLYDEIKNADANQWVAPWPSYAMASQNPCSPDANNTLICPFNVVVEQNDQVQAVLKEARIDPANVNNTKIIIESYNRQTGERLGNSELVPLKVALMLRDEYVSYNLANSTISLGLLITIVGGTAKAMYSDAALVDSMFTKMFYNEGQGLEYFDLVKHNVDVFNQDIYVYKIDWSGSSKQKTYSDNQYLISHILICAKVDQNCPQNRTQEQALAIATQISKEVNKENFAQLAIKYSDDPSGKLNSGNLGWNNIQAYVPEFGSAVKAMKVGDLAGPVKTPFGYHIIYLKDAR